MTQSGKSIDQYVDYLRILFWFCWFFLFFLNCFCFWCGLQLKSMVWNYVNFHSNSMSYGWANWYTIQYIVVFTQIYQFLIHIMWNVIMILYNSLCTHFVVDFCLIILQTSLQVVSIRNEKRSIFCLILIVAK